MTTSAPGVRVAVAGARGRMGRSVCEAVEAADGLDLVAQIDEGDSWDDLAASGAAVLVDFTSPAVVMDHIELAIRSGIHCVVGTSGFTAERLTQVGELSRQRPEVGIAIVPNFALGAVLAMKFARMAARYFDAAEIIELHHAHKLDAPSGTALAAAHDIAQARREAGTGPMPDATVSDPEGARGADIDGVRVHAVRLPGLVAHLEVVMGSAGETLTIRHDSFSRESFMPGVITAIRAIGQRPGLTVGLEPLLDD